MLRRFTAFCWPPRPVFLLVFGLSEPSSWRTGVVLLAAGVVSLPLLPTALRILVVHNLPRCVSVGTWFVGVLFLHGALDSHLVFPSRAVSGRCVLTATAACVPAGVVSTSADPPPPPALRKYDSVKCGNTGSPRLEKPLIAHNTYHGTHVGYITQTYPSKHHNTRHFPDLHNSGTTPFLEF